MGHSTNYPSSDPPLRRFMTKKQQKWSGLKLTKEELNLDHPEEKAELVISLLLFLIILGLIFIVLIIALLIGGV